MIVDLLIRVGPSAYEPGDVVSIHSPPLKTYGTGVDTNPDFRIVRVVDADLLKLQNLIEPDVLHQEQLGKGFDRRRRKQKINFSRIPATRNMVDAEITMQQLVGTVLIKAADLRQ